MAYLEPTEYAENSKIFEQFLERDEQYQTDLQSLLGTRQVAYRLEVNLRHLEEKKSGLSAEIMDKPYKYLPPFEHGLSAFIQNSDMFKDIDSVNYQIRIGVTGDFGRNHVTPRGLSHHHVNKLVCIDGVVTSMGVPKARPTESIYWCSSATVEKPLKYKEHRDNTRLLYQEMVTDGGGGNMREDEFGNVYEHELGLSVMKDQQKMTIQEAPEDAPTGRIPVSIEVILEQDQVDCVKPGDRVRVVGVYKSFPQVEGDMTNGVFLMRIIANSVKNVGHTLLKCPFELSDTKNIKEISRRPDFFELLSRSFAPSISGNDLVKKGLMLTLIGGSEKNFETGTHLRGDINLLLVGDPSCGKSQLLRFVMRMCPISVSTTGRGSSGVGLTAAVKVDQKTGERTLQAGAMVLGDGGTVCIDEFDKMNSNDRVAIHEVMEQQTVTIAKAGIHCTLKARCSVIAAANPVNSTWDDHASLNENINLPDSLLSRFDLIFVLKDEISKEKDRRISQQVLKQLMYQEPADKKGNQEMGKVHDSTLQKNLMEDMANKKQVGKSVFEDRQNHPSMSEAASSELLTVDFLKKYVRYCRERRVVPQITKEAAEEVGVQYAQLRQRMVTEVHTNGKLPVTTRTLEAIIRMSTAHARLRLSSEVAKEDVQVVCALLQESRYMEVQHYDEEFDFEEDDEDIDIDGDNGGKKSKKDKKKNKKRGRGEMNDDDDDMGMENDDIDEDGDVNMDGNGRSKRSNFVGGDQYDASFLILKNMLFDMFMRKKTLDISKKQFRLFLDQNEVAYTDDEIENCLILLSEAEKITVDGDVIYLTT